jgi:nicotinic acid mononucleotide adenylyltransferase
MNLYMPDGQFIEDVDLMNDVCIEGSYIYSGSFNPLHDGHKTIANLFENVVFEVSQTRYEKEPYTDQDIIRLTDQFAWKFPIVVTDKTLFLDKVELFNEFSPKAFIMGYDTFKRFLEMTTSDDIKTPFNIVAVGRKVDGINLNPKDLWNDQLPINVTFVDLYMEISSTQIRKDAHIVNSFNTTKSIEEIKKAMLIYNEYDIILEKGYKVVVINQVMCAGEKLILRRKLESYV